MRSMLPSVQSLGCVPRAIAAFSAGSPKASKPIGNSTLAPFMRRKRAMVSEGAIANQCPMCRSPEV